MSIGSSSSSSSSSRNRSRKSNNLILTFCKINKNGDNICGKSKCKQFIGVCNKTRSNDIFNHVFISCEHTDNIGEELKKASVVFEKQFNKWMNSKNMTNPSENKCKLNELLLKQEQLASAEVAKEFWKGETIRVKVPRPTPSEPTAKRIFTTTNRVLNELWNLVDLKAYDELLDIHAMLVVSTSDLNKETTNPYLNDEDLRTRCELLQEENNILKKKIDELQSPAAESSTTKLNTRSTSLLKRDNKSI